ncbi:MAG: sugar transferase [Bacteroidales bacterium]|nr:sugar transferase [Bacteroidales bacterium]
MIWRPIFNRHLLQILDFATLFFTLLISFQAWRLLFDDSFMMLYLKEPGIMDKIYFACFTSSLIYVMVFNYVRPYKENQFFSVKNELKSLIDVSFFGYAASFIVLYFIGIKVIPRSLLIVIVIGIFLIFSFQKSFMVYIAGRIRARGVNKKRIIIIGTGPRTDKFLKLIQNKYAWGFDVIGIVGEDQALTGQVQHGIEIIDSFDNLTDVLKVYNPEEVIITLSTSDFESVTDVLRTCETEGVAVRFISDFLSEITKNVKIDRIDDIKVISFSMVEQPEWAFLVKRVLDIIGAIVAIVLFLPVMIVAAIGILISDGFPIFYKWNVVGLNKKPFRSWKFRTMVRNADQLKSQLIHENEMDGPVFKIKNDPRIIPFGKWLRKWSIDETPQFFSVLKGNMSLVGPRPAGPHELDNYDSWHRRKLSIRPGITCLWQVSGRNAIRDFDEWVRLDLEYIDNWSIGLDLKIIMKTILTVFKGNGK